MCRLYFLAHKPNETGDIDKIISHTCREEDTIIDIIDRLGVFVDLQIA